MNSSLLFDDVSIGDVAISTARTITEADVVNFCGVSGDFSPIHLDAISTRSGTFGQPVAPGLLGMSIASALQFVYSEPRLSTAGFLGVDSWRFHKPLFVGDTVHTKRVICDLQEHSNDHGRVDYRIELINQADEICQSGIMRFLVATGSKITATSTEATQIGELVASLRELAATFSSK